MDVSKHNNCLGYRREPLEESLKLIKISLVNQCSEKYGYFSRTAFSHKEQLDLGKFKKSLNDNLTMNKY